MPPPVIAIVGPSGSGKTRVATALIKLLSEQGYRIAAVKHCPHGHRLDWQTKDSARLFTAGASEIIISSPGQQTRIQRTEDDAPLNQIVASLDSRYDLVVAEGFKTSAVPKVLVLKEGETWPLSPGVIAVVGGRGSAEDVPRYAFQKVAALAGQILDQIMGEAVNGPAISPTETAS